MTAEYILQQLYKSVAEMRNMQKHYFAEKNSAIAKQEWLKKSKDAEKKVDAFLDQTKNYLHL